MQILKADSFLNFIKSHIILVLQLLKSQPILALHPIVSQRNFICSFVGLVLMLPVLAFDAEFTQSMMQRTPDLEEIPALYNFVHSPFFAFGYCFFIYMYHAGMIGGVYLTLPPLLFRVIVVNYVWISAVFVWIEGLLSFIFRSLPALPSEIGQVFLYMALFLKISLLLKVIMIYTQKTTFQALWTFILMTLCGLTTSVLILTFMMG